MEATGIKWNVFLLMMFSFVFIQGTEDDNIRDAQAQLNEAIVEVEISNTFSIEEGIDPHVFFDDEETKDAEEVDTAIAYMVNCQMTSPSLKKCTASDIHRFGKLLVGKVAMPNKPPKGYDIESLLNRGAGLNELIDFLTFSKYKKQDQENYPVLQA